MIVMITVRSLVFALCDKYGDQTSIEFLLIKLRPLLIHGQNKILSEQMRVIKKAGFTPEEFFGNEQAVIKARKKMALIRVSRLADAWARLVGPKAIYTNVAQARVDWRNEKRITRDCRKYKGGQPDRNMVKIS